MVGGGGGQPQGEHGGDDVVSHDVYIQHVSKT